MMDALAPATVQTATTLASTTVPSSIAVTVRTSSVLQPNTSRWKTRMSPGS